MKKTLIMLFAAALVVATSCEDKKQQEEILIEDSENTGGSGENAGGINVMRFKDAGTHTEVLYTTEHTQPYYYTVFGGEYKTLSSSEATVKVLNEQEFGDYKEQQYGRRDFQGLVALNPDFYYLVNEPTEWGWGDGTSGYELTHKFENSEDRNFGFYIVIDGQKCGKWWNDLVARATLNDLKIKQDPTLEEVRAAAMDSLNNYQFVVPVGLFSETDSVDADNRYVMLMPNVQNPTLSVSIPAGGWLIEEIPASKLLEDADFRNGTLEPEVTFSIPCSNQYGFSVKITHLSPYLDTFNSFHTDIVLRLLENRRNEPARFESCNDEKKVHFPAGVTEVKMPLKIFCEYIEPDSIGHNYVIPCQLASAGKVINAEGTGLIDNNMDWDNPTEVPDMVKMSLKLPENDVTWEEKRDGHIITQSYGAYCFFVGYRVI